ncbi:uncharacterized protein LOC120084669 [Benincasa hispida]|uniref:uncharacterized protein LOC120084669 n=1 Tax=Benincasa hispida TaxID=102211 RepID=UPI001901722E|nr:uncharacterized protein LOC120084669 [Benincasa hispida]
MDRRNFVILRNILRTIGRLAAPTQCVEVQEMVANFLHILAHDVKNRVVGRQYARSGETVLRHFRSILTVILQLHELLLKKSEPITSDYTDSRTVLGALDDTYIKVNVSAVDRPHYRTRKGEIALNVLVIYSPTGEFIFVLSGGKGLQPILECLGYYYPCDAKYPNVEGFLTPYRGEQYPLSE